MLYLPEPLVFLIFKGGWTELLMLLSWHSCLWGPQGNLGLQRAPLFHSLPWPPPESPLWDDDDGRDEPAPVNLRTMDTFDGDAVRDIAGMLRGWSGRILDGREGEDRRNEEMVLRHILEQLDSWSSAWSAWTGDLQPQRVISDIDRSGFLQASQEMFIAVQVA